MCANLRCDQHDAEPVYHYLGVGMDECFNNVLRSTHVHHHHLTVEQIFMYISGVCRERGREGGDEGGREGGR